MGLSSSCWDDDSPEAAETAASSSWLCSQLGMSCSLCWAEGNLISPGWTGLGCGGIWVHQQVNIQCPEWIHPTASGSMEAMFFPPSFHFLSLFPFARQQDPQTLPNVWLPWISHFPTQFFLPFSFHSLLVQQPCAVTAAQGPGKINCSWKEMAFFFCDLVLSELCWEGTSPRVQGGCGCSHGQGNSGGTEWQIFPFWGGPAQDAWKHPK